MRLLHIYFLLLCCVLAGNHLFAQGEFPEIYQKGYEQNHYARQQAIPMPPPCYEQRWEEGMNARRQGDYKAALEAFQQVRKCDDFPDDQQLIDDLNVLIEQAKRSLSGARTTIRTSFNQEEKAPFRYSRAYLYNRNADCFDINRREADRAFGEGHWDIAANIYRAAKSCVDANQTLRMQMDERIIACREAAEDELKASEQKAVRRERHAVASNLARQARTLLKSSDRTISYRLADFANEYVAPDGEDNADCLQAMYDAWYYSPEEHGRMLGKKAVSVPFCYQLKENMESFSTVQFAGKGDEAQLFVFAPTANRLYRWMVSTFNPIPEISVPEGFSRFAPAPDARNLVFISDNEYLIWHNQNEQFRVSMPGKKIHCFSPDGQYFAYLDAGRKTIRMIDLEGSFGMRKGSGRRAPKDISVKEITEEAISIQFEGDQKLWIGYPDRYECWDIKKESKVRTLVMLLPRQLELKRKYLYPRSRMVIIETDTAAYVCRIPPDRDTILSDRLLSGTPLAYSQDAGMSAHFIELNNGDQGSAMVESFGYSESRSDKLALRHLVTGEALYTAYLQPGDLFGLKSGSISDDGHYFAALNDMGTLKVWNLNDDAKNMIYELPRHEGGAIKQDGVHYALLQNNKLTVAPLDQPEQFTYYPLKPSSDLRLKQIDKNWVLYAQGRDSLVAQDYTSGKSFTFHAPGITNDGQTVLNADAMTMAYIQKGEQIIVRSLHNGAVLHSIPGDYTELAEAAEGRYVVGQRIEGGSTRAVPILARLWDPGLADEKLPVVRLHEFNISQICTSPSGKLVAFSDEEEIRIFALDNLLDELVRLNKYRYFRVREMVFTPDETALAVIYDNHSIVFWDLNTRRWRFHLVPAEGSDWSRFYDAFVQSDGTCIYQMTDSYLYKRWLSPDSIRSALINRSRPMVAFQPAQIRDLGLESALLYPGNFDKLANSDDLPLIRSFLDFYQEQAVNSHNIDDVADNCYRAYTLYVRLEPGAQRALNATMVDMYSDFHWKLLLRNNTELATEITEQVNKDFGHPRETIISEAHTELLKHNIALAARGYARWIAEEYARASEDHVFTTSLYGLEDQFIQLVEYDLLEDDQLACACATLSGFIEPNEDMCDKFDASLTRWLPEDEAKTYTLLVKLYQAKSFGRPEENARFLEEAYATLKENQTFSSLALYNQVVRQLAKLYMDLADFEFNLPPAEHYMRRAVELLEQEVPNAYAEKQRLEKVILNRSLLIEHRLMADDGNDAELLLLKSIENYNSLVAAERDTNKINEWRNRLAASIYEQLGRAYLLQNRLEDARKAFELADASKTSGLNRLYFGHVHALVDEPVKALEEYLSDEGILDEAMYGRVARDLDQFMDVFPEKNIKLKALKNMVFNSLCRSLKPGAPKFDEQAMKYFANSAGFLRVITQDNWEKALSYSMAMRVAAEQKVQRYDASDTWKEYWLDAHINQSYCLLFQKPLDTLKLSKAIHYSIDAQDFIAQLYPAYRNSALLKTNLAHAYWLRNYSMDRRKALNIYFDFIREYGEPEEAYRILLKDFRDLYRNDVILTGLADLVEALRPEHIELTEEEWQQMGLEPFR